MEEEVELLTQEALDALEAARSEIIKSVPEPSDPTYATVLAVLALAERAIGESVARARTALAEWRAGRTSIEAVRACVDELERARNSFAEALWTLGMSSMNVAHRH
jgi:hypothetical protein